MLNKIRSMYRNEPIQSKVLEEDTNTKLEATLETVDDFIPQEKWDAMTPEQQMEWEHNMEEYLDSEYDSAGLSIEDRETDPKYSNLQPATSTKEDDDYIKNSPEIVGFNDLQQQIDSYEIATESIEPGESILDFGCGRGDLYNFLYNKNGEVPKYKGIDINEPLINTGIQKYAPDINIETKDWNKLDNTYQSTWCVNVGSLCTRYDSSTKDDFTIVTETIDKMMTLCTLGSVLILFSSNMPADAQEDQFIITDPTHVFNYAIKKYGQITGNIILDHSFSDSAYKITILKQ